MELFSLFFFLSWCGDQARSLEPHSTAKHKKTKPTKPHKVSTVFVQAQNFSSATSHHKTHPEDIKTDSSAKKKNCFPWGVLHILTFPHPDQEAALSTRNRWILSTVRWRLIQSEMKSSTLLRTSIESSLICFTILYFYSLLFKVVRIPFLSFSRLAITVSDFTLGFFSGSQTGGRARTRGPNLYLKERKKYSSYVYFFKNFGDLFTIPTFNRFQYFGLWLNMDISMLPSCSLCAKKKGN